MDESNPRRNADSSPAEPSLVMQRIALNRERIGGWTYLSVGVVGIILALIVVVSSGNLVMAFTLVIWIGLVGVGAWRLITYRRRRLRFEAENGVDAGRQ